MKNLLHFLLLSLILPAVFLADNYVVSGAGDTNVNGTYEQIPSASLNDRPVFKHQTNSFYIYFGKDLWEKDNWWITEDLTLEPVYYGTPYYSNESSALLPPESGWATSLGSDPAPTVSPELLPVELISFNASIDKSGKNNVMLNWQTASEINNYGFEIERSAGEKEKSWTKIGFINGAGNSDRPMEYSFLDKAAFAGNNFYRLKQIDINGNYEFSSEVILFVGDGKNNPDNFNLAQNYPNPFNPSTTLDFFIPEGITHASLKIFNLIGQEVSVLLNGNVKPGLNSIKFEASGLNSGVYLYKLEAGNFSSVKKLTLLK